MLFLFIAGTYNRKSFVRFTFHTALKCENVVKFVQLVLHCV